MRSVLLTVKTDKDTKARLKSFAEELGVTSSALVNMVVKQVLRERQLVLTTELEPTPYLEQVMSEADDDYRNDRDITHTNSPDEALAHLDSLMQKK